MAPWPSPVVLTALCTWLIEDTEEAGMVMTEPPLKSTVKFRPAAEQPDQAEEQDHAGDRVPELLPPHEVEGDLAPVEAAADVAEPRHHASFAGVVAPARTRVVREDRHGVLAPSRTGSRPE